MLARPLASSGRRLHSDRLQPGLKWAARVTLVMNGTGARAVTMNADMSTAELPIREFDAEATKVRLRVKFNADPAAISQIVEGVMKVVADQQCACGHELDIEIALRESLANAILHGAGSDASKKVECSVACDESRGMLVVVRDPGEGFDPAAVPSPLLAENLFANHGRGIYLINQLMDHVEFTRGGTEIRMRKFPKTDVDAKTCGLG